jgi:hypothetical protein
MVYKFMKKYLIYVIIDGSIECDRFGGNLMAGTTDRQLEDIKRLLVLLLMKLGAPSRWPCRSIQALFAG